MWVQRHRAPHIYILATPTYLEAAETRGDGDHDGARQRAHGTRDMGYGGSARREVRVQIILSVETVGGDLCDERAAGRERKRRTEPSDFVCGFTSSCVPTSNPCSCTMSTVSTCSVCSRSFTTDADLQRHISLMRDDNHKALRAQPLHTRARPAPQVDDDDDPMDFEMDSAAHLGVSDDEDDGDDFEGAHAEHVAALDEEPVIDTFPGAGRHKRTGPSQHQPLEDAWRKSGLPFFPFRSKFEYEFSQWLVNESISSAALDRLLAIDEVRSTSATPCPY